jgi:ubiquinone biosynthesis protein
VNGFIAEDVPALVATPDRRGLSAMDLVALLTKVARGLETLQDRLPPFPEAEARGIVESELGRPLDRIFTRFGPPVAAASIAQVHEAETTDDPPRHVAVKILRPGIEAEFARDFDAFRLAADLAERFSAEGRRLRLRILVETLAASVALELDLRMEAAAASELAQNTRGDEAFHVPAVDWSRTSQRVCTSEWVDGAVLRDAQTLAAAGHARERRCLARQGQSQGTGPQPCQH